MKLFASRSTVIVPESRAAALDLAHECGLIFCAHDIAAQACELPPLLDFCDISLSATLKNNIQNAKYHINLKVPYKLKSTI